MTGETPEVRSDKRKPREDRENHRYHREKEKKREKKREKERKREKNREKDPQGLFLSICIQFSILNSMMFHNAP